MARSGWRKSASLHLHRTLNRRLDAYIAVSQSVATGARERRETGGGEVAVIAPGIELPSDETVARARTTRSRTTHPVVVFVGRLEAERQLDVLLRAVPIVRGHLADCRFVIAGSGAAEDQLKLLAHRLGIEDAVTWKGWVADPYRTLEAATVYVNPWPWEGFGMAMAEAMALELPVIAVDSGASSDMVKRGSTGLLVPAGDADALAAAIVLLGDDRKLASQMGAEARRHATSLYGVERIARSTLALYRRIESSS